MNEHGVVGALSREAYKSCIPLNVSLELTLACNLKCVHCYNFDRDQPRKSDELSFDDWRRVMRELREEGTLFLNFTGGEAMAYPRFWDLLAYAAELRFAVTVLTNGTLLTDAACDRLASNPALAGVSLSIYGNESATHDGLTQVRGSWERTMRGAERMRARGVLVQLKYIVMRGNAHEVGAFLARGLPTQVDATITGRYDGTHGSLATRADVATVADLYRGPLRGHLSKRKSEPADDEFKCNCARANAAVLSNGDVTPCIAVPLRVGSVRAAPFGEIWRNAPGFRRIRGLKVADFATCAPCPLKAWCRRSPGPAVALHGEFTGVDPWVCEEAAAIKEIVG